MENTSISHNINGELVDHLHQPSQGDVRDRKSVCRIIAKSLPSALLFFAVNIALGILFLEVKICFTKYEILILILFYAPLFCPSKILV